MIIPSASDIRILDSATIQNQHIQAEDLMERAAKTISNYLIEFNPQFKTYAVFCGTGNNGGDGLCIARHLLQKGYAVQVFICNKIDEAGMPFMINYKRLINQFGENVQLISRTDDLPELYCDCIIDALLGTGLNKPVDGFYAEIIQFINLQESIILAVDIPSGLAADHYINGPIIKADITISFEFPKLAFFFPENKQFVGEWMIFQIGLLNSPALLLKANYQFVTELEIHHILQSRPQFGHKGTFGHALIIGGSEGMEGAAALSGMGCLRAGAGLTTISGTEKIIDFPELMQIGFEDVTAFLQSKKINAISIGPGLGKRESAKQLLQEILTTAKEPLVIDADALNIIADNSFMLKLIPENSILTPHPKEFERLFGKYTNWDELPELMRNKAQEHKIYIIYKRAYTLIAAPDGIIYFNSTGNAGMATAGSGDVLTGIITAFIAQDYTPLNACLAGVFLHGLAGDLAMEKSGGINLIATDIIQAIPDAVATIF